MEKTYHLDLKTLLEYLREKSAVLRTRVTLPRNRHPGQGYLFLSKGSILRCYVLAPDATLLVDGPDAYKLLNTSVEWYVRIDTEQMIELEIQAHLQGSPPPTDIPTFNVPVETRALRQLRPLEMAVLQHFPAKQSLLLRTVFTMVNGERTADEIKGRLRLPPQVVEEALNILRNIGVIG
jgi:hypothetical protein